MEKTDQAYPASYDVDYPEGERDRFSVFVRIIMAVPALFVLFTLSGDADFNHASKAGGEVLIGLSIATAVMILFQQKYPRWWFDFALELNRYSARVGAYVFLMTDQYPSTTDKQTVHLDIAYPNVKKDLNNWYPLVKWLLAIPHYICLLVLYIGAVAATIIAWFAILLTGRYPRDLFDFIVGVGRWTTRVNAYAFMLVTDQYPPFSLK